MERDGAVGWREGLELRGLGCCYFKMVKGLSVFIGYLRTLGAQRGIDSELRGWDGGLSLMLEDRRGGEVKI